MEVLDVLVRIALALVFAVAAVGKARDLAGTRRAVRAFGAPDRAAAVVTPLLPIVELVVAVGLLVPATAQVSAMAALVLLAAFSVAIARSIATGTEVECHCFGAASTQPVGAGSLVRNAALGLGAAFVVVSPDWAVDVEPGPWTAFAAGVIAGIALMIGPAIVLLRRHGRVLLRLDELEGARETPSVESVAGKTAPEFDGLDELLEPGRPLLLLFSSPGCAGCEAVAPRFEEWRHEHAGELAFATLTFADDVTLANGYGVRGTPAAVLVAADGTIAADPAYGPDGIERLLEDAVRPPALRVGAAVPPAILDRLVPDRDTLLLFWNPSCGFCKAMRPDLDALDHGSALLVANAGLDDDGFAAVVPDPDRELAEAFGARGTPMAVLVAPDGTLASDLAAGATAVLELAGALPELEVLTVGAAHGER